MKKEYNTDVAIIGAGPSGTSTALGILLKTKLSVTIIEQSNAKFPKIIEHAKGSLFNALEELKISKEELINDGHLYETPMNRLWGDEANRANLDKELMAEEERTYLIDRAYFDFFMLKRAVGKGASIFPRTKCINVEQRGTEWVLRNRNKENGDFTLNAKFLVDATGRNEVLGSGIAAASVRYDDLVAIGMPIHVESTTKMAPEFIVEACEVGWWQITAVPNQPVSVVLFTDEDILADLELKDVENWKRLLNETQHIRKKVNIEKMNGQHFIRNAFSRFGSPNPLDRYIAVGDAAFSFDPIAGIGIEFAVRSAIQAASAIKDSHRGKRRVFEVYAKKAREKFMEGQSMKNSLYHGEQRWASSSFWKKRT